MPVMVIMIAEIGLMKRTAVSDSFILRDSNVKTYQFTIFV